MTARRFIARSSAALLAGALVAAAPTAPAQAAVPASQIIAGSAAPVGSWPSMAALEGHFSTFVSHCGGTVIAPHWVITAGHCTYGNDAPLTADQMTVTTGRPDLGDTSRGQTIQVAQIIRHPGYRIDLVGQDIALLRLATATSAPPMQVATQDAVASYRSPAGVANTAGWGWTAPGNSGTTSQTLNETYVPLRTNADCAAGLAAVAPFEPSNMVCAGASGPTATTTCHGDSGGPLVVFAGNAPVLWGLTSWGVARCDDGLTAFTRVAAFESFLAPALAEIALPPAAPVPAAPAAAPAAPQPATPAPASPSGRPVAGDSLAPALSRFQIPGTVFVRGGRVTRPIAVRLHVSERATLRISLMRTSGRLLRPQRRLFVAKVVAGTSRIVLPRSLWRLTPGSYRLRIEATDASGNGRAVLASIRARLR